MIQLVLFTQTPQDASAAEEAGMDGLIVDWEWVGKSGRQVGYDTEVAKAPDFAVLSKIREKTSLPITVRINPFDSLRTEEEISRAVDGGADKILLAWPRTEDEVARFLAMLRDRATPGIMIETASLVSLLPKIADYPWVFGFIGLHDLMISRGGSSLWDAVGDGTVEHIMGALPGKHVGFGGVTAVGGGSPIPFKLLAGEMARLGCAFSFLRRSFRREVPREQWGNEVVRIRGLWDELQGRALLKQRADKDAFFHAVRQQGAS